MIDSHCHLESRQFEGNVEETVRAARSANIQTIVNIGTDLKTSKASIDLAERYSEIYATVGYHPHEAKDYSADIEFEISQLVDHPKVVAVGEIGLDFYRDLSPRPVQHKVFRAQLELAVRKQAPVVVHVRESFEESFGVISEYAESLPGVVFHCFSGGVAEARRVFDLGCIISVGGVVTYKNSKMAEVAAFASLEKIMLETDAPYLTPIPHRGKRNQPSYIPLICAKIAELKGITTAEVERVTDLTTQKFYRLVETFGD